VLTTYFTAAGFKEGFSDEEFISSDESHGGHRTAAFILKESLQINIRRAALPAHGLP